MSEAKTHVIDGKTYVEVERKAEVGEKVVGVYSESIRDVVLVAPDGKAYAKGWEAKRENYRVLEPVDQAPSNTEDLIANLVRRVAALESQLRDVQGNVERPGVEIAEIAYATQAPQSGAKLLAEAFEALAKYERSVRE